MRSNVVWKHLRIENVYKFVFDWGRCPRTMPTIDWVINMKNAHSSICTYFRSESRITGKWRRIPCSASIVRKMHLMRLSIIKIFYYCFWCMPGIHNQIYQTKYFPSDFIFIVVAVVAVVVTLVHQFSPVQLSHDPILAHLRPCSTRGKRRNHIFFWHCHRPTSPLASSKLLYSYSYIAYIDFFGRQTGSNRIIPYDFVFDAKVSERVSILVAFVVSILH